MFVSSPDDVAEARREAERVVVALDDAPLFAERLSIKARRFETSAVPQAGPAAQQVVDAFTGRPESFDVFVLIIGQRLGTEFEDDRDGTRYRSGTVYELDRAYRAYQKHGRPIILTYQYTGPSTAPPDPAQVAAAQEFLAELGGKNGRYRGFKPRAVPTTADFGKALREDLERVLCQFLGEQRPPSHWRLRWALVGLSLLGASSAVGYHVTECGRKVREIVTEAVKREAQVEEKYAVWRGAKAALVALGPCAADELFRSLAREDVWKADRFAAPMLVEALAELEGAERRGRSCDRLLGMFSPAAPGGGFPEPVYRAVLTRLPPLHCPRSSEVACDLLTDKRAFVARMVDPPDDLGPVLSAVERLTDRSCQALGER